jgi:YVTN family beta-propeller protein
VTVIDAGSNTVTQAVGIGLGDAPTGIAFA